ncbi:uncharacterized protein HKW66_Vig0049090 [Vigna angularis]|uniref:Rx N-terminal domain-containing protein n=1 Tax=Phaseolus angularis TaxID=3914 RepID=A0A8T0L194_PHAAN|nr:uncharacterized protein HKW66_Vig0049090 [Vigna angularis]
MAELFLFSIAESLIAKLASHAFQEASRVVGLFNDLRDLTKNLSLVKAVLLDAQQKQDHNHQLREWLTQLKTVFSEAEDVLDEFECQTLQNKVVKAHRNTKDKVSHFLSTSNPLLFRYKMTQQIKYINKRLDKVAVRRHKFSLQIIDVDTRVVYRRDMTHSRVSDSDVIGRKNDKEKIIELLMQQNPNDDDTTAIWGSLGLIALPKTSRTLEDVANQYLHELLSRSFLQDFETFGTKFRFRIHDLVHDLALFVATDECLHVNFKIQNIPDNVRHLSFAESSLFGNLVTKKSAVVRSVLFSNGGAAAKDEAILNTCLSKFKCLRVLDLHGSTCKTLPRAIAKMKHLRYLDISENLNIKRLPDSICKLQSLQVLSIKRCKKLEILPKGLRKLISLRSLDFSTKQTILPLNEIAQLGSLEYLVIESCHNVESIFGGVKFHALKTLVVRNCQSLKSMSLDGQNFPELETLVVGACGNLDLELCKGNHEEESPKLKLKFIGFNSLSQLVALPKWFQEAAKSLQCLFVSNCDNIETLPDWLPTLTDLKALGLINCPNLVSISDNIHYLTALESLKIRGCANLYKKYEPNVGEFWPKISHIKNIVIDEKEEPMKNYWKSQT